MTWPDPEDRQRLAVAFQARAGVLDRLAGGRVEFPYPLVKVEFQLEAA